MSFLTIPEVAAELQCSRTTVHDAIKRGDLEAVRYGRLVRVSRRELDRFLAAHSTSARQLRRLA